MKRIWTWCRFVWDVVQSFNADKCTFLAAGLCYFVFFSIFPFLLLLVAIAGHFLNADQAMNQATSLMAQIFPQHVDFVFGLVQSLVTHRGEASVFGILALVWSAKNIFLTLGQALNIIWKVPSDRGVVRENLLAIALSLSVGLLIFVLGLAYAVLSAMINFRLPFLGVSPRDIPGSVFFLADVLPWLLTTVILMALYKVLPNRQFGWRQVLPGALAASLLWEAFRRLFGFYLTNVARYDMVYGSISGIVGFMFWIFVSASLFLLGAEICWVLNEHRSHHEDAAGNIFEKIPLNERQG